MHNAGSSRGSSAREKGPEPGGGRTAGRGVASPGAALRRGSLPGSGPSGRRWLLCFPPLLRPDLCDGGRGVAGEWLREKQASPPACARGRREKLGACPVPQSDR